MALHRDVGGTVEDYTKDVGGILSHSWPDEQMCMHEEKALDVRAGIYESRPRACGTVCWGISAAAVKPLQEKGDLKRLVGQSISRSR